MDLMIGRKIVLFPLIVDIELIGDTSEIYKPFWSQLYLTAKQDLEKIDCSLQMFDIGETFTLAGSDSGNVYTWGSNDFYQLGRKTSDSEEYENSVDFLKSTEIKNPEKVYNLLKE